MIQNASIITDFKRKASKGLVGFLLVHTGKTHLAASTLKCVGVPAIPHVQLWNIHPHLSISFKRMLPNH